MFLLLLFPRKVKEAWETKREMLEESGTVAIEQLSEALSMTANSSKISDELAHVSLKRCSRQVFILLVYITPANASTSFISLVEFPSTMQRYINGRRH